MRKIIFLMHVSLDGFVNDKNGGMDWITYDSEVEKDVHDLHATTDTAIYGRVTYEMMAGYWPTVLDNPQSTVADRAHATWVNDATKIVVSTTLTDADITWKNTVIIRDHLADEINKLKQQSGKDMWFLGSPTLAQTMMQLNLIDEYRLNVSPIILGGGKPLFGDLAQPHKLTLLEARTFKCGVVGLRYVPAN